MPRARATSSSKATASPTCIAQGRRPDSRQGRRQGHHQHRAPQGWRGWRLCREGEDGGRARSSEPAAPPRAGSPAGRGAVCLGPPRPARGPPTFRRPAAERDDYRSVPIASRACCSAGAGAIAFSGKAIIVKLGLPLWRRCGHGAHVPHAVRVPAVPRALVVGGARQAAAHARRLAAALRPSASAATTSRASSTSAGLQYISANLERLILYLNPTHRARA